MTFPVFTFALHVQQTAPLQEKGTSRSCSIAASRIDSPLVSSENSTSSSSQITVTLELPLKSFSLTDEIDSCFSRTGVVNNSKFIFSLLISNDSNTFFAEKIISSGPHK